jgi:hypothetical protein
MLHLNLSARCASSLLLVGILAAPSPADDLFVASSNTFFARGNALNGGFQSLGACFGQPQSIVADANGTFQFGPGIGQFSQSHFTPLGTIQAGQTWHFQGWYRNTVGPCGSGFNTPNAFDVTFTP